MGEQQWVSPVHTTKGVDHDFVYREAYQRGVTEGRRQAAEEIAEKIEAACPDPDSVHAAEHCDYRHAARIAREWTNG